MNWTTIQVRKGLTTLIVLDALEAGACYAYGLRRAVHDRTQGVFSFSEGSLYPLLHTLRARRWVTVRRRTVRGRERRYYTLTAKGRQARAEFRREWAVLNSALARVVHPAPAKHQP